MSPGRVRTLIPGPAPAVQLIETTLCDGLRDETAMLSTAYKVALAHRLAAFGARRLEVTSFVNPERVPQMADADERLVVCPTSPSSEACHTGCSARRRRILLAMSSGSEVIDRALAELAASVAAEVRGEGWLRRDFDPGRYVLVMTRPAHDGVFASVEVRLTGLRWPRRWPEMIDCAFGAGFEAALGLMPLVTLPPSASLVSESDALDEPDPRFEIASAAEVPRVAVKLATEIRQHGVGFAERYDVDDLEAALADDPRLRAVLLASAGRTAQARSALERYLAGDSDEARGAEDERFVRQLTRWLDAGNTTIPPVEQTLSRLPPPSSKPSWPRARTEGRDRSAARNAVRAAARGKTRQQIQELLATEYAARGLNIAPSTLAYGAEMIELEQQPFGKLRGLIRGLGMIKSAATDAADMVRDRTPNDPKWMQPSPRATYLVDTRRPDTAITLNPAAAAVIARAADEATRRLGPIILLEVWLDSADNGRTVRVHLGEHEVGTLPDNAARQFAVDLAAADELFDEAIRVHAALTPAATGRPALLEIGTPKHAA